jgi:hypothetical protein
MKGVVIDEPWIGMILLGEKQWEMRPRSTRHRGAIALVRKGSGTVVGVADLVDCLSPLSVDEYRASEAFHRIPPEQQPVAARRWPRPWILRNVCQLSIPVPYRHKFGAQSEIILSAEEAAAVKREEMRTAGNDDPISLPSRAVIPTRPFNIVPAKKQSPMQKSKKKRVLGRIEGNSAIIPITNGNIVHNHFYLRSVLDFFPEGAIGGSDRTQTASELLTIIYQPGPVTPSRTDIAGPNQANGEKRSSHYFFRDRKAIGEFFARSDAKEGDEIIVERTGPLAYSVTLQKPA